MKMDHKPKEEYRMFGVILLITEIIMIVVAQPDPRIDGGMAMLSLTLPAGIFIALFFFLCYLFVRKFS